MGDHADWRNCMRSTVAEETPGYVLFRTQRSKIKRNREYMRSVSQSYDYTLGGVL